MSREVYKAVKNYINNELGFDGAKVKQEVENRDSSMVAQKLKEVDSWYAKYKEADFDRSVKHRLDWLNSHMERHAAVYVKDAIREILKEEIRNAIQIEVNRLQKEGLFDVKISLHPKVTT